jgi:hypothetical protein
MTIAPAPWLPPAARGDVESALARWLGRWLEGWIAEPCRLRVQPRTRGEIRALQWRGAPGAMVGAGADAEAQLGRDLCGGEGDVAHQPDRDILRPLATRLLDDLASSLQGLAEPGNGRPLRDGVPDGELFTAAPEQGGWSIALALAPATVIALRKAVAAGGRRAAVGSRQAAIAPQMARLGCQLGQTRLSAGDVAALAVGDVIVLDRRPGIPLPLTIEGHVCARGKVVITRSAEGAVMTIAEKASLLRKMG